jgi:hypothetical protein
MPKNPNVKRTEILLSMRLWAQAVACAKLERKSFTAWNEDAIREKLAREVRKGRTISKTGHVAE